MDKKDFMENAKIIIDVANKYRDEILKEQTREYEESVELVNSLGFSDDTIKDLILTKEEFESFMEFVPPEGLDVFTLALILHAADKPPFVEVYRQVRDGEADVDILFGSALDLDYL